MTDGYVGDDLNIVAEVKRHPNARVFAFGIGSSVNHFLLDKMAEEGRGEVEYVGLKDDGSVAARRFYNRVRNPLLTDVSVDWGNLPVSEVYPRRIPDLFSATPVILSGRFDKDSRGVIRLRGKMAGKDFYREIPVTFSANESQHDVLASLWARRKVDDLMSQDWASAQTGRGRSNDLKEPITQLGLDYHLMTQFTSFVAVEDRVITEGGRPRRVEVPVEMPEGVSRNGVFGGVSAENARMVAHQVYAPAGGFLPMARSATPTQPVPVPMPMKTAPEPNLDKLSPALVNLVKTAGGQPGRKVEVMVLTIARPEGVLRRRETKLGREEITIGPNSSNLLTGRIEVSGLTALSQLASVRTIAMK